MSFDPLVFCSVCFCHAGFDLFLYHSLCWAAVEVLPLDLGLCSSLPTLQPFSVKPVACLPSDIAGGRLPLGRPGVHWSVVVQLDKKWTVLFVLDP